MAIYEKNNKLTNGFGVNTRPFYKGIYQREFHGCWSYAYWDGSLWYQADLRKETAISYYMRRSVSGTQNRPWRGLVYPIAGEIYEF